MTGTENLSLLYTGRYYRKYKSRILDESIISELDMKGTDSFVDIGCGNGDHVNFIAKYVGYACGVDFSESAIEIARKKYPGNEFFAADARSLSIFKENTFDKCLCLHVLEHIEREHAREAILEIKRIVKPGGLMLFGTLDKSSFFARFIKDKTHMYEYRKEEFIGLLRNDFEVVNSRSFSNIRIPFVRNFVKPDIYVICRNF